MNTLNKNRPLVDIIAHHLYQGYIHAAETSGKSVNDLHSQIKPILSSPHARDSLTFSYEIKVGDVLQPRDMEIVEFNGLPLVLSPTDRYVIYKLGYPEPQFNLRQDITSVDEIKKLTYMVLVYRKVKEHLHLKDIDMIVFGHMLDPLFNVVKCCRVVSNVASLL
jgi:hypothetical protein